MVQQLATNTFTTAKWIVSPTLSDGTHTTIGAALTSASSGDTIFIRPGTYTENITLKAGVNLVSYTAEGLTPNVTIIGKCTFTTAGTVSISGIRLQTNSDFFLAVTGAAASIVYLKNCFFNCSNNTGISYTSSSASSQIIIEQCDGNIATTGIAYYAHSSAGNLRIIGGFLNNTGASITDSTISAGTANFYNTQFANSLTISNSVQVQMEFCSFVSVNNNTALTLSGTSQVNALKCNYTGGSASAVSIGAGCLLNAETCSFNCTNTNAVTGAGSILQSGSSLIQTRTINVTTQAGGVGPGLTNSSPSAGYIGEQIRSYQSTPQSVSNNTGMNITSINITAGVWDVSAVGAFIGNITGTLNRLSISSTSATVTSNEPDSQVSTPTVPTLNANICLSIPSFRVALTGTTTYYLVGFSLFSAGTMTATGRISATRVG